MSDISEPFTVSSSNFYVKNEGASFNDIRIESKRLFLTPISQTYAEVVFEEFTPEIRKYMAVKVSKTLEETRSFIDEAMQGQQDGRDLLFVILKRSNAEFLGTVGLHTVNNGRRPALGVWVKKGKHGNGIGLDAVEAVCKWAEKNLIVDKFIFEVAKENSASRKIPEKLNGVVVREGKIRTHEGHLMDEITYHIPIPVCRR